MQLPETFLQSIQGVPGFNRDAFVAVHESGNQVTSIRINPAKTERAGTLFEYLRAKDSADPVSTAPIPWSRFGYYLSGRPSFTFDPLFHAGTYYVQEASSMFLEQAFQQVTDVAKPLKVLDLCGAPGGKSTHIQSLLSADSLLVCNEVIRSRTNILADNIKKWGCSNTVVTNNDPAAFGKLPGFFDVLVVDAPCSGSGLFRRDTDAIGEWSLNNVALCSARQQRILADALPALKEGGLLVYSTCSYSTEEDESIADWLVKDFGMQSVSLTLHKDWGIVETGSPEGGAAGYRFFPDKVKGEGFFMACFRKTGQEKEGRLKSIKPEKASAKERAIILPWLQGGPADLVKGHYFSAIPAHMMEDYSILSAYLNIVYAGTGIGNIMKDRLVPEHSLAVSTMLSGDISGTGLDYRQAISYLQRNELIIEPERTGWQVVNFLGKNLGWINALSNRINNYYPKELRILKQQNNAAFEK